MRSAKNEIGNLKRRYNWDICEQMEGDIKIYFIDFLELLLLPPLQVQIFSSPTNYRTSSMDFTA